MRLALWTPRPSLFAELLRAPLPADTSLALITAPGAGEGADIDLYHLADRAEHGFVYRALLARPGIVVLEDTCLHALVHAETAGRGDPAAYLAAARRWGAARGAFIARQVLAGLGGDLVALLALDDRVLESALAVVATSETVLSALAPRLRDRPLVLLPESGAAAASLLLAVALEVAPRRPARVHALSALHEAERTTRGRALASLRPLARELGLPDLPAGVARAVEGLLPAPRAGG